MNWFDKYQKNLLKRIYGESPYGGSDKLDALWLFFLGGGVFAALDVGLNLQDPIRLLSLLFFLTPGLIWAGYVWFHEYKAFWLWLKERKESPNQPD